MSKTQNSQENPALRLEEAIGYLTYRAQTAFRFSMNQALERHGFGDFGLEQWRVLRALWVQEGLTQNEIGVLHLKDKTNVTRLIDQLEKKGLVERRNDPADRRVFRIFLTKSGKAMKKKLLPIGVEVRTRAIKGLSDEDVRTATRVLRTMTENLLADDD